jgi:hypothetical protein
MVRAFPNIDVHMMQDLLFLSVSQVAVLTYSGEQGVIHDNTNAAYFNIEEVP